MPSSYRPVLIALLVVAALGGAGCGDADHQAAQQKAAALREELKQATTTEEARREEVRLITAKQEEEIRKNEERIKALRAENAELQKQLEATPKPAEAAPAKP